MKGRKMVLPELLNEKDAARAAGLSVRTLQAMRVSGRGPCFVKLGRAVRYSTDALRQWIDDNSVASVAAHKVKERVA